MCNGPRWETTAGANRLSCVARGSAAALAAVVVGCSGAVDVESPPTEPWWIQAGQGTDPPADGSDTSRFLHQATFGPVADEVTGLQFAGFEAWFERQRDLEPTLARPTLEARAAAGESVFQNQRQEEWWRAVVHGEDQLRQRMAFALSEILVISDRAGSLKNQPIGVAEYYDVLVRGAFGNYRQLLEDVTLSPAMGLYLSHLRNSKGDPVTGIRPDENYARELMQLFTLGLVELELDGTPRLAGGNEVPSYTQADIEELSCVLTGWTYAGATRFNSGARNMLDPMTSFPEEHDDGAKTLLGAVLPAGLSPEEDLDAALDVIFAHGNVAPFVSLRLIQRLVTSNPSAGYVARVAAVFEDDGTGERGDLFEVAKAILMDEEARQGHMQSPATFGKLREPLVRLAGLWRAFDAEAETGRIRYWNPESDFGQAALRSPSVFNFFYPDFEPPGPVTNAGLVAPEFQITTHTLITTSANEFRDRILRSYPGFSGANEHTMTLELGEELALAADPAALVAHLDLLLMGGVMSAPMRSVLEAHVAGVDMEAGAGSEGMQRVIDAIYLIVTSPEGAMQR